MSKEAVVFVLDVGPSMWQTTVPGSSTITLLDKAIKCTSLMQSQKIIDARKTDQVALVVTNTPGTDNPLFEAGGDAYSHITVAQPFDSAKYELIRYLQDRLPLGEPGQRADPVDSIVVAADLLIKLTKGKAYGTRRIIFLSNFDGGAPCETGVEQILDELRGTGISLTLVNLNEETGPVLQFLESKFVEPLGDDSMVLGIDDALGMLHEYGAKRARPTAVFRGTLDLGVVEEEGQPPKGLRIPVSLYSKTSSTAGKLPSAKKMAAGEDQVERSLEYRRVDTAQTDDVSVMPTVEKANLIKAYRYGKTLVPFTRIDEEALAYQSNRCLSILGFVPASSIDRAMYMSSVWLVEPEPGNNTAAISMTAIVQACYEKDTIALARYVRAKNNTPKLVALIPKIKPSYAGFLLVALPYAQDLRRFTFPSLEKMPPILRPTREQKEVMKDWIKSMSLADDDESLKPSTIRNPTNQRLVQCILSRIQDPTGPVPPIEQSIIEPFLAPPAHLSSTSTFQAVKSSFQLRKAEKWKHAEITRFWDTEETGTVEASTSEAVREKSVDDDERPEPHRHISKEKPLEDFEAMVRDRHHDLVVPAFKQLMALIPLYALEEATISLAIDCLMALRKSAIQEDEHDLYNAYLQELKRAAFAFRMKQEDAPSEDEVSPALLLWNALEKHPDQSSVTLISNAENPGSLVTPDHAQTFYS